MPGGRPTKYNENRGQELIDAMETGLSFEASAAKMGVNVDTLKEWAKVHPEFSAAKREAFERNRLFWEQVSLNGLNDRNFNTTNWIFQMKNRFGWRDKVDNHTTLASDPVNPPKIEIVFVEPDAN